MGVMSGIMSEDFAGRVIVVSEWRGGGLEVDSKMWMGRLNCPVVLGKG